MGFKEAIREFKWHYRCLRKPYCILKESKDLEPITDSLIYLDFSNQTGSTSLDIYNDIEKDKLADIMTFLINDSDELGKEAKKLLSSLIITLISFQDIELMWNVESGIIEISLNLEIIEELFQPYALREYIFVMKNLKEKRFLNNFEYELYDYEIKKNVKRKINIFVDKHQDKFIDSIDLSYFENYMKSEMTFENKNDISIEFLKYHQSVVERIYEGLDFFIKNNELLSSRLFIPVGYQTQLKIVPPKSDDKHMGFDEKIEQVIVKIANGILLS